MRNESQNHQFGKQRVVKGVIPSSIHQNQHLGEFEKHQFGKEYDMQGTCDIILKENFKLFISGPSRCGKTVFFQSCLRIFIHLQNTPLIMKYM